MSDQAPPWEPAHVPEEGNVHSGSDTYGIPPSPTFGGFGPDEYLQTRETLKHLDYDTRPEKGIRVRELALAINPMVLPQAAMQNVIRDNNRLQDVVTKIGWAEAEQKYPEVRRFLNDLDGGCQLYFGSDCWDR